MIKFLVIVAAVLFIPYLAISKAQQLKNERQARVRYFIFIAVAVILVIALIRTI